MTLKRPNPLEDPPSFSSTDDDASSKEDEEVESDEEEEEEADPPPPPPPPLNTPHSDSTPNTDTNIASESDEDSDSDDEESPENPQPIRTVAIVKPIATKSMTESPAKPKKSISTITTNAKPTKRALESDKEDKGEKQQKKKKVAEEDGGQVEETEKKSGRVWSEEDEIVILKGMASLVKKGKNPSARSDELFDTIKHSLSTEVTKTQLVNKIPKLKHKYQLNVSRSKNGEDPAFSKLIDQKAYQLGKKIWGNAGAKDAKDGEAGKGIGVKGNSGGSISLIAGGNKSNSLKSGKGLTSPRPKPLSLTENVEFKGEEDQDLSRYRNLYSVAREGKEFGNLPSDVKDILSERRISLLSSSKKNALEGKWKKMRDQEVDLYFRKMDLVGETANVVKDEINARSSRPSN